MTKQTRRMFLETSGRRRRGLHRAATVRAGRCQQPDPHGRRRLQWPRQEPHRWLHRITRRALRLRRAACSAKRADKFEKSHGRKLDQIVDFRKLLDRKDIDAISIATPNHTHSLIAISAAQAGKDVYVEKPVSHNVWEGRQLVNAAEQIQAHHAMRHAGALASSASRSRRIRSQRQARQDSSTSSARATSRGPSIGKLDQPLADSEARSITTCGAARPRRSICIAPQARTTIGTGTTTPATATWATRASTRWISPAGSSARTSCRRAIVSFGGRLGYEDAGNTANTQVVLHDYAERAADLRNPRPAEVEGSARSDLGRLDGQLPRLAGRRHRAVRERLRRFHELLRRRAGVRTRRRGNQDLARRRRPLRQLPRRRSLAEARAT